MTDLDKIKARRSELAAQLRAIEQEERELQIAEKVLLRLARIPAISPNIGSGIWREKLDRNNASDATQRAATTPNLVLQSLTQSAVVWLTSNEVQADVTRMKGAEVPMSTISPTLSNLKKDGIIVRDGNKVALRERALAEGFTPQADTLQTEEHLESSGSLE